MSVLLQNIIVIVMETAKIALAVFLAPVTVVSRGMVCSAQVAFITSGTNKLNFLHSFNTHS